MADSDPTVRTITVKDGRELAYAEYGEPNGHPVFFFHGTQSSRLERHRDESIARGRGARIIATDRRGQGLSDFQPGRTLLDWPDDVTRLADSLGLDRFAVMGMSAGGPYALACAHAIPERLSSIKVIAGAAPLDDAELSSHLPTQLKLAFAMPEKRHGW